MYIPSHFRIEDRELLDQFIVENSFGLLVSTENGLPVASHLPFHYSNNTTLLCHVAKANPQWQALEDQRVLVIFPGPHAYVSPTWYAGPGVPTWNYQAVHVYGRARCFQDEARLEQLVRTLSKLHESGSEAPWNGEFDARLLKAIVGIEITLGEVQGKYKLSQNKSEQDRREVIAQLKSRGESALAQQMRQSLADN